jgi:ATP-binding cassette, subfamily C, bacterial CydC
MLSRGEAQRLNLVRGLLSDATLVLLDEPAEHLDLNQVSRILKRVLSQLEHRIVIHSSHAEFLGPGTTKMSLGAP